MKYVGAVTSDGTEISLDGLTVLVGPNNSGKSTTLRDIYEHVTGGAQYQPILIRQLVRDPSTTSESLLEETKRYAAADATNQYRAIGPKLREQAMASMEEGPLKSYINAEIAGTHTQYRRNFGKFHVAMLDTESRLELAKSGPSHDVSRETPSSLLQMLYGNQKIQIELDDAFHDTFGLHIKFDFTSLKTLYLRVGHDFSHISSSPEQANVDLLKIPQLDLQGDGMRSFTAVVLSLLMVKDRLILLDEPDAFLHPEQARRLGRWLADKVAANHQQVIIATHNSHFLNGIVSAGGTPQIFRLNYRSAGVSDFNRIPGATVRKFGTDPLLSSQRVVEAIFHALAVVCEADSDRTIYQAVALEELNNNEVLFVNAQNKQTCAKVASALKEAHIPVRSVVDFDILRDNSDLKTLMNAHDVPADIQSTIQMNRREIANAVEGIANSEDLTDVPEALRLLANRIEADQLSKRQIQSRVEDLLKISEWAGVKRDGIAALDSPVKEKAQDLINALFDYGIAVVSIGELESWIDLPATKSRWVEQALEKIYAHETPKPLKEFVARVLEPVEPQEGQSEDQLR